MTTIAEAALQYARERKWKPIPVARKTKKPIGKGWQKRPFTPEQFDGNAQNVAVQLGAESGGLCDIDLDHMLAIGLAPEFLPATEAIFGRRSKPLSHQLYVSDLHKTEKRAAINYETAPALSSSSASELMIVAQPPCFRHRCTPAARVSNGIVRASPRSYPVTF